MLLPTDALKPFAALLLCVHFGSGQLLPLGSNNTKIETSYGTIRGKVVTTASGNTGRVFLGVPYASPPVGALRFRRPAAPAAWTGERAATDYTAACPSNTSATTSPQGNIDEDCLYLNIFTGQDCGRKGPLGIIQWTGLCPVVYYVHGGGYNFDAATMFPVDTLVNNFAANGVVMVVVGYRLGTFGFWRTPDTHLVDEKNETVGGDGNYALADIIAGLEWVQREIKAFGGDATNVTVMGHSSGAECASLLSMLPASQQLMHRAIVMSGTTFKGASGQSTYQPNNNLRVSAELSAALGCANVTDWSSADTNWTNVMDCMRQLPMEDIVGMQRELEEGTPAYQWTGPAVDDSIFPLPPSDLHTTRPAKPMLTGTTDGEYNFATESAVYEKARELYGNYSFENATRDDWLEGLVLPVCELTAANGGYSQTAIVGQQCMQHYGAMNLSATATLNALMSDFGGYVPCYQEADSVRAAGGPVYLYSFDYNINGNPTMHSKDLTFVMGIHPFTYDANDTRIAALYPAYFANFARTGNPTPTVTTANAWQPLQAPVGYNYYSVGLTPANEPFYHYPAIQFWTETVPSVEAGAVAAEAAMGGTTGAGGGSGGAGETTQASTGGDETNWQLGFWILLGISILLLLWLIAAVAWIIVKRSQKQKRRHSNGRRNGNGNGNGNGRRGSGERQPLLPADAPKNGAAYTGPEGEAGGAAPSTELAETPAAPVHKKTPPPAAAETTTTPADTAPAKEEEKAAEPEQAEVQPDQPQQETGEQQAPSEEKKDDVEQGDALSSATHE